MNLSSILLKKVLIDQDLTTWALCQQHYFPQEFHSIFQVIQKHLKNYNKLPTFEDLELSTRDSYLKNKIVALSNAETVDVEALQLLDYLKNEFTQSEIMDELDKYLENSVSMSTAEENIEALQDIIVKVEDRVDLRNPEESMDRMNLFDSQEDINRSLSLGLNKDYDSFVKFSPTDLVLFGGRRGAGKSLTCANIASSIYQEGGSVIYFTIEMPSRSIMQRIVSISTNIPINSIRARSLTIPEWQTIANWWSKRFESGDQYFNNYLKHRSFDKLHEELTTSELKEEQIDLVYDPSLTISKIQAEIDKKLRYIKPRAIIVDYLNQIKRSNRPIKTGQYDWTEQIEVSKALKSMAQEYEVTFISPYQTDATGEARFAKGILDAPDAAFALDTYSHDDNVITFKCVKMRNGEEDSFTSVMDWATLKIGPESGKIPGSEEDREEEAVDI